MTEEELKLKEAEEFAHKHVREIAAEIIEWQNTSILRSGRLRELADICSYITSTHALNFAEGLAVREALLIVGSKRNHESS